MSDKIKHTGIIDMIEEGCVKVRILQSSACSGCKVASHCNASETKEKLIEVPIHQGQSFQIGDPVMVEADVSVGFKASFYGYLLPLLLMVAALIIVLQVTQSEGMAALSALGILVPYYLTLYLLRNQLKRKLTFEIK